MRNRKRRKKYEENIYNDAVVSMYPARDCGLYAKRTGKGNAGKQDYQRGLE